MFHPSLFIEHGRQLGLDLYTGVPCSLLKPFINYVIDDENVRYVPLTNEGEAIAYACGAYLAGKRPVVMFQNSGLGNAVNPLVSLAYPLRIPLLIICTWRAQPGISDEPQHELMGPITPNMFSLMEVANEVVPEDPKAVCLMLDRAVLKSQQNSLPYALIMPKGIVESYALTGKAVPSRSPDGRLETQELGAAHMRRGDVIRLICDMLGEDVVILGTTGYTNRELFAYRDSPNHLYIVGAMGGAPSVGLGLATHLPDTRKVVVLDGDGAALMRMEAMASIGHFQPSNLIHVLLDNQMHESTGGQGTLSSTIAFDRIAQACGYKRSQSVSSSSALEQALDGASSGDGPTFIHVRIIPGTPSPLPRPTLKPHEVKARFMSFLGTL
ncbi:MAG: phosphonopyruvate decarboxylase [Nitrospirae bacterium]|nr:phosphonopyruvate decarboxylase [Nitrospirota bacterium]